MRQAKTIFGILIIIFGVSALLGLPAFKVLFQVIFPVFLIWIGFEIIFGRDKNYKLMDKEESHEDLFKRVLIFSGINKAITSDDFKGAEIVAIFGGGEIDLSKVKTTNDSLNLELVAVFGGLKITIPKDWRVISEGVGVLGGFDNQTKLQGSGKVTVKIEGVAIFGGVEVVS